MFWEGVYALSKRLKVTDLFAQTFASPSFEIPPLQGEILREKRSEYVLTIGDDDFAARLSSIHKRNIKKARAVGVTVRRCSRHPESLMDHARMIGHSRDRLAARGESVSTASVETKEHCAYLASGAGELFQAVYNGHVVSSYLLLRSAWTACGHSTGTSPEGMRIGASPFLIHSICGELHREGVMTFNLGGAPEGSSLAGFKAGFGAAEVLLCTCACYLGPSWLKKIRSAIRVARTDRRVLWKLLVGHSQTHAGPCVPTAKLTSTNLPRL
jgi:lipid II:glycine glycyltransferase (peptidoglycan interpeptide bridge formation enzyme)